MSAYIEGEMQLAAHSFLLGIILMMSYDFLRLFRFFIHHGSLWTGLEDLAYWLYAAVMTFLLMFRENDGKLRGYIIICAFFGMFLYDRIVSRNVFGLLQNTARWITMRLKYWKGSGKKR